jgi:PHD/YefM family antitoxin component YafN of YafNO toxin-antitoxin module
MISANDLKVKGIKAIEQELQKKKEAIITFRGKPKFIVLSLEEYERAKELDKRYIEYLEDKALGNVKEVTAKEHIQELMNEIQNSSE